MKDAYGEELSVGDEIYYNTKTKYSPFKWVEVGIVYDLTSVVKFYSQEGKKMWRRPWAVVRSGSSSVNKGLEVSSNAT